MATTVSLERKYARAAEEYLRALPPEHFMEANSQAIQRKITLASLQYVAGLCPEIQNFNEMLIQYPQGTEIKGVVPDNMIVHHPIKINAEGSFDLPLQPVGPLVVLEYVSKRSKRKDYVENKAIYEGTLKIPYYLIFRPSTQELHLFHHDGKEYLPVLENEHLRLAITELEIEVAVREGWVRFWHRGKLVPLPDELSKRLPKLTKIIRRQKRQIDKQAELLEEKDQQIARLRAFLDEKK